MCAFKAWRLFMICIFCNRSHVRIPAICAAQCKILKRIFRITHREDRGLVIDAVKSGKLDLKKEAELMLKKEAMDRFEDIPKEDA